MTAGLIGLYSGVCGAVRWRDVASVMQEGQGPHQLVYVAELGGGALTA